MTELIHFLNGKFVKEEDFLISPRDLGFVRGYSVAEFIVTNNHKLFKLSEHIERLFNSANLIGLKIPWSKEQIKEWVNETLNRNDKDSEVTIKIIISGGVSRSMYQAEIPNIVMIVSPYIRKPIEYYEKGLKAKTIQYKRPYAEAKHTHYIQGIKSLAEIKDKDVTEIIYYDDNQVFEGSGNNLFAVINNVLTTTKTNIIKGITRNTLLEILKLSIPIEVRDFTLDELYSASEIFFTGSGSQVTGIIEIDGKLVGNGLVGATTKEAARQYKEYIAEYSK
jgi:branched-chain amino acid aminotransferase